MRLGCRRLIVLFLLRLSMSQAVSGKGGYTLWHEQGGLYEVVVTCHFKCHTAQFSTGFHTVTVCTYLTFPSTTLIS